MVLPLNSSQGIRKTNHSCEKAQRRPECVPESKTKAKIIVGKIYYQPKVKMNNDEIENVTNVENLVSVSNNNGNCTKEVIRQLAMAIQRLNTIKTLVHNCRKNRSK